VRAEIARRKEAEHAELGADARSATAPEPTDR
jgi:hypothetical protein